MEAIYFSPFKAASASHLSLDEGQEITPTQTCGQGSEECGEERGNGIDFGFRAGKVGRAKGDIKGAASLFPACGQTEVISPYRSVIVGRTENKIRFVVFSEKKQQFLEKRYAYASAEIGSGLHRGHSYRVRFGDKPKYPVIDEIIEEVILPVSVSNS